MRELALLAIINLYFVPSSAQQSLTSCPTAETIVQDSAGNSWASCPQTDYAWGSLSWIGGVKNDADCASYCTNTQGCTKAVYDRQNGWCHAKGDVNNGLWQQNNQYNAIRPYTGPIASCPTTETSVQDSQGRTWAVCPFSGKYLGTSVPMSRDPGYVLLN